MKLIEFKCPNCEGQLTIAENRRECFCEFCGTHLMIDSENRTVTNVTIIRDEARIKEADVDLKKSEQEAALERIKLQKQLELERLKAEKEAAIESRRVKAELRKAEKEAKAEVKRAKIEAGKPVRNTSVLRTTLKVLCLLSFFGMFFVQNRKEELAKWIDPHKTVKDLMVAFIILFLFLLVTHRRKR